MCESFSHCRFVDPQGISIVIPTIVDNYLDYADLEFLNPQDPKISSLLDPVIASLATKYPSSQLLHQRFGHISNDKIR
jgi:hypothetical protein